MRGARAIRERRHLPELKDLGPELAHVPRWEAALSLLHAQVGPHIMRERGRL